MQLAMYMVPAAPALKAEDRNRKDPQPPSINLRKTSSIQFHSPTPLSWGFRVQGSYCSELWVLFRGLTEAYGRLGTDGLSSSLDPSKAH